MNVVKLWFIWSPHFFSIIISYTLSTIYINNMAIYLLVTLDTFKNRKYQSYH